MANILSYFRKAGNNSGNMSLMGHLQRSSEAVLPQRLLFSSFFIVCFFFIQEIAEYLLRMGLVSGFEFVYLSPSELMTAYFGLSLVASLCVSAPFILYSMVLYCASADGQAKEAGYAALFMGFIFFVLGILLLTPSFCRP